MSEFDIILDNSRQNLKEVPSKILNMCNLKMLYLQQNRITRLPNVFFLSLPVLSWLDLRHNQLTSIPETVAHHQHLENFLLSDNKIVELPNELGLVPNLKVLQLANNPITYPNAKVVASGTKLLCLFLKAQYEKELASMTDELSKESQEILYPQERDEERRKEFRYADEKAELRIGEPVNPSLMVQGLSKSKMDEQVVHKISRDKTNCKLLIKSYFDDVEEFVQASHRDNDNKIIYKNTLKQEWIDKLKTLLEEQEKILQQERNLQALSSWRYKKKTEPVRTVIREEPQAPYATYPEYDSIISREELIKQIDRSIEHNTSQSKQENVETLINDLVSQLKEMENTYGGYTSPRSEIESAGTEIMKVMEVHKKLLKLQRMNDTN